MKANVKVVRGPAVYKIVVGVLVITALRARGTTFWTWRYADLPGKAHCISRTEARQMIDDEIGFVEAEDGGPDFRCAD